MIPRDLERAHALQERDDAALPDLTYGLPDQDGPGILDSVWEAAAEQAATGTEAPHGGIDRRAAAGVRFNPPSPAAPVDSRTHRRPDRAARDERRARAALRPSTGLVDSSPIDPPIDAAPSSRERPSRETRRSAPGTRASTGKGRDS